MTEKETRRIFLQKTALRGLSILGGTSAITVASTLVSNNAYAGVNQFKGKRFGWERGLDGQIHHYVEFDVFACYPSNARFSISGPFNCTAYPSSKPMCGNRPLDSYGVTKDGHVRGGIRQYDWMPLPPDWFAQYWTLTVTT